MREILIIFSASSHRILEVRFTGQDGEIRSARAPVRTGHIGFCLRELERLGEVGKLEDFGRILIEVELRKEESHVF
jgi:hypothetical protein